MADAGNATTNDLSRIHGRDEIIVASGASDTLVYSTNRGESWSTLTSTITGTIQALWVVDDYLCLIVTGKQAYHLPLMLQ